MTNFVVTEIVLGHSENCRSLTDPYYAVRYKKKEEKKEREEVVVGVVMTGKSSVPKTDHIFKPDRDNEESTQ